MSPSRYLVRYTECSPASFEPLSIHLCCASCPSSSSSARSCSRRMVCSHTHVLIFLTHVSLSHSLFRIFACLIRGRGGSFPWHFPAAADFHWTESGSPVNFAIADGGTPQIHVGNFQTPRQTFQDPRRNLQYGFCAAAVLSWHRGGPISI